MKQSLARTAVVLAAAPLALGLTAPSASAEAPGVTSSAATSSARPTSGAEFVSGPDKAKQRKIQRLHKKLDLARVQRADARAGKAVAFEVFSDADLAANDSQAIVLRAAGAEHKAKDDLVATRTDLHEARTLIENEKDLLAKNETAQLDTKEGISSAEADRTSAETKVHQLAAAFPLIDQSLQAAKSAFSDANNEVQFITDVAIPRAEADVVAATTNYDDLRAKAAAALDLYFERTLAYQFCEPQMDNSVNCWDNTGVYLERGEVTDPWRNYIAFGEQARQAHAEIADARVAVDGWQVDLVEWTGTLANREVTMTNAQADVDSALADMKSADELLAAAKKTIATQQDALTVLADKADDLATRIEAAKVNEKGAVAAEVKHVAALAEVSAALATARDAHEADLTVEADAAASKTVASEHLVKKQERARRIKERLKKAWKAAR